MSRIHRQNEQVRTPTKRDVQPARSKSSGGASLVAARNQDRFEYANKVNSPVLGGGTVIDPKLNTHSGGHAHRKHHHKHHGHGPVAHASGDTTPIDPDQVRQPTANTTTTVQNTSISGGASFVTSSTISSTKYR